jgi:hypothetical protein
VRVGRPTPSKLYAIDEFLQYGRSLDTHAIFLASFTVIAPEQRCGRSHLLVRILASLEVGREGRLGDFFPFALSCFLVVGFVGFVGFDILE